MHNLQTCIVVHHLLQYKRCLTHLIVILKIHKLIHQNPLQNKLN
ncbi:unnamed protein product [Schistosoma mattheei]|uniref:Uncharacterized protein n=1 Tax=Schistosoma mattheei TaxID=31246 RepID=A0A3P8AQ16_9TREM|nr:unnamed protein product [Schistosoma mattheei]